MATRTTVSQADNTSTENPVISQSDNTGTAATPDIAQAEVKPSNAVKKPANVVPTKQLTIPRGAPGEENFVIIGVNGKNWKIRRGETVTVPYFVKDAYDNSMKAARLADNYRDQLYDKNNG